MSVAKMLMAKILDTIYIIYMYIYLTYILLIYIYICPIDSISPENTDSYIGGGNLKGHLRILTTIDSYF